MSRSREEAKLPTDKNDRKKKKMRYDEQGPLVPFITNPDATADSHHFFKRLNPVDLQKLNMVSKGTQTWVRTEIRTIFSLSREDKVTLNENSPQLAQWIKEFCQFLENVKIEDVQPDDNMKRNQMRKIHRQEIETCAGFFVSMLFKAYINFYHCFFLEDLNNILENNWDTWRDNIVFEEDPRFTRNLVDHANFHKSDEQNKGYNFLRLLAVISYITKTVERLNNALSSEFKIKPQLKNVLFFMDELLQEKIAELNLFSFKFWRFEHVQIDFVYRLPSTFDFVFFNNCEFNSNLFFNEHFKENFRGAKFRNIEWLSDNADNDDDIDKQKVVMLLKNARALFEFDSEVTFKPQYLEDPSYVSIKIFIEQYTMQRTLSQQKARIVELESRLAELESEEDNNRMDVEYYGSPDNGVAS